MAGLEQVSGPAVEPLSLAEAKLHLRLDGEGEDELVLALVRAARELAERYTGRALVTRRLRLWLDAWPPGRRALALPSPPLADIVSVVVHDADDEPAAFDPAGWLADRMASPGRLVLRAGVAPPVPGRAANGIAIEYDAGYGAEASDVPEPLRRGIALAVGHLFEHREAAPLPAGVEALWAPYRMVRL